MLEGKTKLWQPRTIFYVRPFWFSPSRLSWNFPYEHTTEFVSVTEPARVPGSYEEALILKSTRRAKIIHVVSRLVHTYDNKS